VRLAVLLDVVGLHLQLEADPLGHPGVSVR
jgi:hypothetical protein